MDVEYNNGLVYFAFWLPLLEKLLDEWTRFEMHDGVGSYLAHDMGARAQVGSQAYPHPMQVEENANDLPLLHAFWRWTGNLEPARRHHALCRRLVDYFEHSDTTGNGFPNEGVANTIDDASAAVQYAREQVYLAVKTLGACHAAAQIAKALGDSEWQTQCETLVKRIEETLDAQAWLGDHYAVCLERTAEGLRDPWTGEPLHGELSGWDAYSIYTHQRLALPADERSHATGRPRAHQAGHRQRIPPRAHRIRLYPHQRGQEQRVALAEPVARLHLCLPRRGSARQLLPLHGDGTADEHCGTEQRVYRYLFHQ
ncbi:MAG: hypothetical protein C4335_08275 [Armatimonadota bacterium]